MQSWRELMTYAGTMGGLMYLSQYVAQKLSPLWNKWVVQPRIRRDCMERFKAAASPIDRLNAAFMHELATRQRMPGYSLEEQRADELAAAEIERARAKPCSVEIAGLCPIVPGPPVDK